ncbi:phosphoribosylanthranilate isomerase [Halorussus litoreus]|uniref:phosphoribosylanthranilate isomerase n=1 Tax=Halorussus litoreus TaxID=1710536 RepID=UPI000E239A6E|nr:phosphoribosylanthranilate isomerase [Halorussus litoreus]
MTQARDSATRVKVCGITCPADLRVAVEAGADAIGLLVDVPVDSPREIDAETAAALAESVPPFVTTVLVTMAETPEEVVELANVIDPDAVQVHGELSAGDLAYLTASVDAQLLKTVAASDPERARQYDEVADALLVDSVDDDGAGGTGRTHDWERTAAVAADLDSPVVLAGGLTPENVGEAVGTVAPFAVDVASGVEREGVDCDGGESDADAESASPSRKDPEAVAEFVENARRARRPPTP